MKEQNHLPQPEFYVRCFWKGKQNVTEKLLEICSIETRAIEYESDFFLSIFKDNMDRVFEDT